MTTELRGFLGISGSFRRFVKDLPEPCPALHAQTSGKSSIKWNSDMDIAFEKIKMALSSPPSLSFSDFEQCFIVETDSSSLSVGSALSDKMEDERVHPIGFASRTINNIQRNHSTCERESLAVIFGLKKFRLHFSSYLPFILITDHQALIYAFAKKNFHRCVAHWLDLLAEYDFNIYYKVRSENGAADDLPRCSHGSPLPEGDDEGDFV